MLVSARFQVLFHSPPGVLFTFPSRYWFAIGHPEYLALRGGPRRFTQGSTNPTLLGYLRLSARLSPTGLSPSLARLPRNASARLRIRRVGGPTTPQCKHCGLGWSPFARRYSGSRIRFPLLWVLRCFSSPRSPRHRGDGDRCSHRPGFPIRRSRDRSPLPAPPGLSQVATSFIGSGAKASTVRPWYLDLSGQG